MGVNKKGERVLTHVCVVTVPITPNTVSLCVKGDLDKSNE